jgi:hypothetical protein
LKITGCNIIIIILLKKIIRLNIPYEYEAIPMFKYIHYKNLHLKKEAMAKKVINNGYFWAGYTKDIEKFINTCGKCYTENNYKLPKKPKKILNKGLHIRYQGDLWYLTDELKKNNIYLYSLDLIDHFWKWLAIYLLKNKEVN